MRLFILSLVVVTPTGPLYIAINTSRSIYCSVPRGGRAIRWFLFYHNCDTCIDDPHFVPGFMFTSTETSASVTINTTDTSITGITVLLDILPGPQPGPQLQKYIELTIYGMLIL